MLERNFSAMEFDLIRLGSWQGKGLPSRQSIAKFVRTYGHIGSEISQVDQSTSSREFQSMLERVNQLTGITDIKSNVTCDKVKEK